MTNRTLTQVFRLLLIIVMVIQPIVITHAMATVHCAQDQAAPVSMQGQTGHQVTKQASLSSQHDSHHGEHAMKDCCNTSTCCSAAIVDTITLAYLSVHADSTHSSISWQSVITPSEIKPPRRLHG